MVKHTLKGDIGNSMTHEDKLKKALAFLATTNAKGASYDYYDYRAGSNNYNDWLFNYLARINVPENEHYPIVTELAKRELIEVHPPESKIFATPPNQIKISFKGMAYLAHVKQPQSMKDKYLQILQEQINKLDDSKTIDFEIWKYETTNILSEIFGKGSSQEEQLKTIKYDWGGISIGNEFHSWDNLETCITKSKQLLTSFIQHINTFESLYERSAIMEQPILEGNSFPIEKRLALVIGNSNYKNTPALTNPINDADEMTSLLTALNFKVLKYHDLDWQGMKKAIDEFGKELENYEVGFLFFAGHGLQINGKNFLVPIEFELISENRVEYECVDAQWILSVMQDANASVNIMVLDACRNNPFDVKVGKRSINVGRGLASMNAPLGTIIAYSTAPGNTADDGIGKNGLYTEFLLKYLPLENILIEQAFKLTRKDVMLTSSNEQIPWESTSLTGDFYMKRK